MSRCEKCIHKKVCIDGANYKNSESCRQYISEDDVAPVRHGYWVKEKRDVLIHWHCSACKECYFLEEPNAEFCPHCGAKMDEEEREEKCLMPKD